MLYKYLLVTLSFCLSFASSNMLAQVDVINMEEEAPAEEATPTEEEAPSEEAAPTEEEAPMDETTPTEEEVPSEEEMPSASDDSELTEDIPINFKDEYIVNVKLSPTVWMGENLSYRFENGLAFGFNILTPLGFNLGNKTVNLSAGLDMATHTTSNSLNSDYSLMNMGAILNTDLAMLNIGIGAGLSMSSGQVGVDLAEEYSSTALFITASTSYTLPLDKLLSNMGPLSEVKISTEFNFTEVFFAPSAGEESATSDFMNFGLKIGYPILF